MVARKTPIAVGTPAAAAQSQVLEHRLSLLGSHGIIKAGPAAFVGFARNGEVWDEEDSGGWPDVLDGQVHLSCRVLEDAEVGELVREPDQVGVGVGGFDADQDQEAARKPGHDLGINFDGGLRDALDDGTHEGG